VPARTNRQSSLKNPSKLVAGGSKKRLKLGRVGTLKASEAREAARKAIANATLGTDLAKSRADERAGVTVAELMKLYIARTRDKRKASMCSQASQPAPNTKSRART
jgi:hypothetical protein